VCSDCTRQMYAPGSVNEMVDSVSSNAILGPVPTQQVKVCSKGVYFFFPRTKTTGAECMVLFLPPLRPGTQKLPEPAAGPKTTGAGRWSPNYRDRMLEKTTRPGSIERWGRGGPPPPTTSAGPAPLGETGTGAGISRAMPGVG